MKKIMAMTALAALITAGCARDEYRGGSWNDDTGYHSGTVGNSANHRVLQDPNTIGGRTVRPAYDSVGGTAQGADAVDRGFGSGGNDLNPRE